MAKHYKMEYSTISRRLKKGWITEEAVGIKPPPPHLKSSKPVKVDEKLDDSESKLKDALSPSR